MGAIEAQAKGQMASSVGQVGDQLAVIEQRRRNRQDTIERVRSLNAFNLEAEQEFTRMSTEGDLTDTNVPKEYGEFLKNKVEEYVTNHGGTEDSKTELRARLMQAEGSYSQNMYKSVTSAQFKAMNTHMETVIKGLSDVAGDMPDTVSDQFTALDVEIDIMSGALTEEQQVALREAGRQQITISAVNTYLAQGDYDAADTIISGESMADVLDSDTMRQIKTKVIVGRREEEKAARIVTGKHRY